MFRRRPIAKAMGIAWLACSCAAVLIAQQPQSIHNAQLTLSVRKSDGAYEIGAPGIKGVMLASRVDAEVNQHWIHSTDYPRRKVSASVSGGSQSLQITFMGLRNQPDLVCFFELPAAKRFGILSVALRNVTPHTIDVQDIRVVDALGEPKLNLGGPEQADRVMAESYSEDPTIHIGGLAQAPHGDYYGVKDDLIHNPESKQSLLLAALTSDKFLTISHLRVSMDPGASASISSFTMDSTGTTEAVLTRDPLSSSQTIYLSLPLLPGKSLSSEKILFAAGPSYFQMLEDYGKAVRDMHHARVSSAAPMGWWSWTAFYGGVNEGDILTNAAWLAAHLRLLGYDYFHIDEGYQYARGEYTIANATQFPHGMDSVGHAICRQGLTLGIWTAPFEVSARAWVYERHKDWLVKDSHGRPIMIGYVHGHTDPLYVLDVTNPAAADYLRDTYRTLTQEWGVRYIKLDFMDSAAIEGRRFRPHTTALEAQRIGLEIIRKAVGDGVLLDKDGSPMLNPVGLVDEGRISVDTGHSFQASKEAAPNIAARFYMNRNFYASDPDAFSVSRQLIPEEHWHQAQKPLTLNEAEVQIVLAAVAGGMYEIGDDLPTLGSEPHRLALVKDQELIDMNRLGRAAIPLDLMTFDPEDQQPSVFFLREDRRQAMLAVFNWTETPRSHTFTLASLYLPADHHFEAEDVLNKDAPVAFENGSLTLNDQPPHSVRLIKLIDESMPAMAPAVTAIVPSSAAAGSSVQFFADARGSMTPALSYQWDFGDGTSAEGPAVTHTYTSAAIYKVKLSVRGIDGLPALQSFSLTVTGYPNSAFDLKNNRRYKP